MFMYCRGSESVFRVLHQASVGVGCWPYQRLERYRAESEESALPRRALHRSSQLVV